MSLTLIIGIGIVAIILIYLSVVLDKEHSLVKLLLILTGITILILIPKATLDSSCSLQINSTLENSTIANLTTTTHNYDTYCYNETNNTDNIFYQIFLYFFIAFWLYVFGYFIYVVLLHYGILILRKK